MNPQSTHQKPLEDIIHRSLKTLRRREIDLSLDIMNELWRLSKEKPSIVVDYLVKGLDMSLEKEKITIEHAYTFLKNALSIINERPEQLQKYYDLGLESIKESEGHIYSFLSDSPELFIKAPEMVDEYFSIGINLLNLGKDHMNSISEAFFTHGVDIAIKKPSKLKKYSEYIRKILSLGELSTSFISDAPEVIIDYPKHFREYAETNIKIIKTDKRRKLKTRINSMVSSFYLTFAKEILRSNSERLSLFGKTGLDLLKNIYVAQDFAEGFFIGGKDIILNCPEKLPEYIANGMTMYHKVYKYSAYPLAPYFFSATKILIQKPQKFKKYIHDALQLFDSTRNCDNTISLTSSYLSHASTILLTDSEEIYPIYLRYAKKLLNIDSKIGEEFLETTPKELILHKDIYENFSKMALKLSQESNLSALKYLKHFKEGFDTCIQMPEMNKFYTLIYNKITPYLKKHACEIEIKKIENVNENIPVDSYNKVKAIVKKISGEDLTIEEHDAFQQFSPVFIKEIDGDCGSIINSHNYPIITDLLHKDKTFPSLEALSQKIIGIKDEKTKKNVYFIQNVLDELQNYFYQTNSLSEDSLEDIDKLYEDFVHEGLKGNKIKIEFNENRLDDYFSDCNDCLSANGKYSGEAQNFILNSYAAMLSINSYWAGRGTKKVFSKETIGRVISCVSEIDGKKALYIAGFSGEYQVTHVPNWKKELYQTILETAKLNKDIVDGIFFDLNPRNRDLLSHKWTEYVAIQLGLEEDIDYSYELKNLSTDKFKTHRQRKLFELINPSWTKIKILRDEGLEGKFFLESVMQEPKNKEIGYGISPDLVYDKGYVVGKYLAL